MNWTGQVLAASRSDLVALTAREEVRRTGVYILVGDDPDSADGSFIYVGESDDVSKRLQQHATDSSKDFWEQTVVVTNKDANLTKAHTLYLESRLIQLAQIADRARLANGTSPDRSNNLPESAISDMEHFLEQTRLVLPLLGIDAFRDRPSVAAVHDGVAHDKSPIFQLRFGGNVLASAQEIDGEFIVRAGATARAWNSVAGGYRKLQHELIEKGILIPTPDGDYHLESDQIFRSVSAAAATILGRPANGRTEWTVENRNQTYADWQNLGISETLSGLNMDSGLT